MNKFLRWIFGKTDHHKKREGMTQPHMMARNSDPETSHEAARTIDTNQMEALVLSAIAKFPDGCIADDVREMFPDIRRHSLIPRIAPLLRCGAIIDTGEKRKAKSGRSQRVVKFVPEPERVAVPVKMVKKWPSAPSELRQDLLMQDLLQSVQQALESGQIYDQYGANWGDGAINILRAALAQPEQEPVVGWFESPHGAFRANPLYKLEFPSQLLAWSIPLYTAPPQRKPLTEEEIYKLLGYGNQHGVVPGYAMSFVRAVEKAHGIE